MAEDAMLATANLPPAPVPVGRLLPRGHPVSIALGSVAPPRFLPRPSSPPRRNDATGPQFTYPVPHSYQQLHGPLIQTALTCDKILFLPVPS